MKAKIADEHTAELILLENYPSSVTELVEFNDTVMIHAVLKIVVFTSLVKDCESLLPGKIIVL